MYTANRFPGVRAAWAQDAHAAELARRHNDANVLALPGDRLDGERAWPVVRAWLDTAFEGGRHVRRVEMIDTLTRDAAASPARRLGEVDPVVGSLLPREAPRPARG